MKVVTEFPLSVCVESEKPTHHIDEWAFQIQLELIFLSGIGFAGGG